MMAGFPQDYMTPIKVNEYLTCYPIGMSLGEGLYWDKKNKRLIFTDIISKKIYILKGKKISVYPTTDKVCWVLPNKNDEKTMYVGLAKKIILVAADNMNYINDVINLTLEKDTRLNDALLDKNGDIWFGTMSEVNKYNGCLYYKNEYNVVTMKDSNYCISNGPIIHYGKNKMFHTDSAKQVIYQYDINLAQSNIKNKKIWKDYRNTPLVPDGMYIDYLGKIWVAIWGGGKVQCFDVLGMLLYEINLPALQITNITFSDINDQEIYITSAKIGLKNPSIYDGALFKINLKKYENITFFN